MNLGYRRAGDVVTFTNVDDANKEKAMSISVYTLDSKQLENLYETLNSQPMVVDSFDDTHVNAHVTAQEDGLLLTTIPYESGWSLKVDGVETEMEIFADAFISIPLTAGEHTLEFSYTPAGLQLGILLTGLSLVIFLALVALHLWLKRRDKDETIHADSLEDSGDPMPEDHAADSGTGLREDNAGELFQESSLEDSDSIPKEDMNK